MIPFQTVLKSSSHPKIIPCKNCEKYARIEFNVYFIYFIVLYLTGVRYNPTISVSDQLLIRALDLFNRDLGEYGRYVCNVFTLFHVYAQFGQLERTQLLKVVGIISN